MLTTWAASGLCLGQSWSRANKLEFAGGWCFLAGADTTAGDFRLSEDDWTSAGVNLGLNSAHWGNPSTGISTARLTWKGENRASRRTGTTVQRPGW